VDLLTTKEPRTLIALHQISRLTLGPNTEDPQLLDSLLQEAITLMDRGLVLRIARKAHNAAFLHRFAAVFGSSITGGVEVRELQGDFCVLRGDYEKAEGHYLRSGQANKALAMWLSLNQIENALRLASSPSLKEAMGQKDLETVWERYAEYCDMRGDTAKALEYYQKLSGTRYVMRGGSYSFDQFGFDGINLILISFVL
jgi:tetratricopeptide (TPR) repeat protein